MLRALRAGTLLDTAFGRSIEQAPARDRAWTHELVYGTVRLRGRLDLLLSPHVRRGIAALQPDVLDVLRLGAYQLIEMQSVPAYAAISQSVELTRSAGAPGAAGLVNGVLQSLRRAGTPAADASADPVERLAGWGSHPRWLVERWVARFGPATAQALIDANNQRPALYIRPVGITPDAACERLRSAGIDCEAVAHAPDALRITGGAGVIEVLDRVPAVVQDPAAGLVVRYADFEPGLVVDLCAAPGGKALAIQGGRAGDPDFVVACDVSPARMQRLVMNLRRLGTRAVAPVVADARQPPLATVAQVLLDAPCTGTGTLRRHPDGKWRLTPADLDALVALQRELLDAASTLVQPAGLLVYATCSLEVEENEDQVNRFLQANPDFRVEPPARFDAVPLDDHGQLRVWPHRAGFDGAFAARLRRAA